MNENKGNRGIVDVVADSKIQSPHLKLLFISQKKIKKFLCPYSWSSWLENIQGGSQKLKLTLLLVVGFFIAPLMAVTFIFVIMIPRGS